MFIILAYDKVVGYSDEKDFPIAVNEKNVKLPAGFAENFAPGKYMYVDGAVVENPDYQPPAGLDGKVAELTEQNQMLTDCILEMSEIIYGGDT